MNPTPTPNSPANDMRVLLLAPTQRDADASQKLLAAAHIRCVICRDFSGLCGQLATGAAAVILPEEAVASYPGTQLRDIISSQPVWSDLPVIVLTRTGLESDTVERAVATLGNVSLVERPVRATTLLSLVRTALRARQRQYEVRDHLIASEHAAVELRDARHLAEAASAAKDEFIAVLSHELRTPLTPVLLLTTLLESRPDLPPDVLADIAGIRRNIELESRLIGDLLDLTKIAKGKWQLDFSTVDLHLLLRSAIAITQREGAAKTIVELTAQHRYVTGDTARLHQVFWNLLSNAQKFTPEGGAITIHTSNPTPNHIRVQISDTGKGIDPSLLPKLFNAFEQGDNQTARKFGGLGLGLAITRKLVEAHHGSITAHSAGPGHGSTFTVDLTTTSPPALITPKPILPISTSQPLHVRILLVEDHEPTLRAMQRLLTLFGHQVATASSVASAKATAQQSPFDLLLSDLGLPDGSGLDLIRDLHPMFDGRSIALTGYGMEHDITNSLRAGFAAHITKPVDPNNLREIIQQVARNSLSSLQS